MSHPSRPYYSSFTGQQVCIVTGAGSYVFKPFRDSSTDLFPLPLFPSRYLSHRSFHIHLQSSGIGLETSLQFASEGAHVLLADINEPAVTKAVTYINSHYPNCGAEGVKCDVSKEEDVQAMVEKAVWTWGRLDVMVGPCRLSLAGVLD